MGIFKLCYRGKIVQTTASVLSDLKRTVTVSGGCVVCVGNTHTHTARVPTCTWCTSTQTHTDDKRKPEDSQCAVLQCFICCGRGKRINRFSTLPCHALSVLTLIISPWKLFFFFFCKSSHFHSIPTSHAKRNAHTDLLSALVMCDTFTIIKTLMRHTQGKSHFDWLNQILDVLSARGLTTPRVLVPLAQSSFWNKKQNCFHKHGYLKAIIPLIIMHIEEKKKKKPKKHVTNETFQNIRNINFGFSDVKTLSVEWQKRQSGITMFLYTL